MQAHMLMSSRLDTPNLPHVWPTASGAVRLALGRSLLKSLAAAALALCLFSGLSRCFAQEDSQKIEVRMSLPPNDTFVVEVKPEWKVTMGKYDYLLLRYANVLIEPREGKSFSLKLFFRCDTPDLAQFDTPEKMKRAVINSSKDYLSGSVEKEMVFKDLKPKGR